MSEPARTDIAPAAKAAEIVTFTGASMMEMIARAASDPNTDVEKFERMVALAERLAAREAHGAYTRAFLAMRPKLPTIDEKGRILDRAEKVQSTYALWEDINDAILPILTDHGFGLSFRPGTSEDGKITVTTVLAHESGHTEETTVTLPHDSSGSKNGVQAVGSSISYAKRYGAMGLLNITSRAPADRDDDGARSGLSQVAQDAIANINMADTLADLRKWKDDHYDAVSKAVKPNELKGIIALYNRRSKAFRAEQQQSAPVSDFPGDRP